MRTQSGKLPFAVQLVNQGIPYTYIALLRADQSCHAAQHGRFSRTRWPYNRNDLSALDEKINALEHLCVAKGKVDVPQFYQRFFCGPRLSGQNMVIYIHSVSQAYA